MVFPNFFITFVRHSFHTSHPYTSPSRERRHRLHHTCHQAPHSPHGTRSLTRHAHALHIAKGHAHATLSRAAPRKGLCHTRCSPSQHPPHTTTLAKGYATRAALPHSTHALHTTPRKGLCHAHASCAKCRNAFPCSPPFLRRKSEPPQPKYYILQYYM